MLTPWKKSYGKPRQHIEKQRHHFANIGPFSQGYGFSSDVGFPVMYGCESWTVKKAECQRINAFKLWCWRKLLRVPWTARRSNPVSGKGNLPWIFIERIDAKAEAPILWPPDAKSWKRPWCWERQKKKEKGAAEDEMVNSITDSMDMNLRKLWETDWSLVCCSPRGCKELENDWTSLSYLILQHQQSRWLGVENSERDGNTRPPDLPLEKPVCRSGCNS